MFCRVITNRAGDPCQSCRGRRTDNTAATFLIQHLFDFAFDAHKNALQVYLLHALPFFYGVIEYFAVGSRLLCCFTSCSSRTIQRSRSKRLLSRVQSLVARGCMRFSENRVQSFRSTRIMVQLVLPGSRASQKFQPLTGLPVMETAAAEGELKILPLRTSAPSSTRARKICPLCFARNSVPAGNRTPFTTQSPGDDGVPTMAPCFLGGRSNISRRTSFSETSSEGRRIVRALNTSKSTSMVLIESSKLE